MNIVDLRDELYKRRIDMIAIRSDAVFYAEELNENGSERVCVYRYDPFLNAERVLASFELEDNEYIEHYYLLGDSIIILFENDGSVAWVVRIDSRSGEEQLRKKLALIGRYYDCVPVDEDNLIIYTRSDDEHRSLFNRCFETTNSEVMANLYDLAKGYRYFVKDFRTAGLIGKGAYSFTTSAGVDKLLLCDPYCGEDEKEELVHTLAGSIDGGEDDLRDNIWTVSKEKLIESVKSGMKKISMRCAASAGVEGTVRFVSMSDNKIILRAKVYRSGLEQFFEMSPSNGLTSAVCDVRRHKKGESYYVDAPSGNIYFMTRQGGRVRLEGEVGSEADVYFPEKVGRIVAFVDDRYIIADRSYGETPQTAVYDSRKNITDIFEARAKAAGDTVILF